MSIYDFHGNPLVADGGGASNELLYNLRKWNGKTFVLHGNSLTGWGKYLASYLGMNFHSNMNSGGSLTAVRSKEEIIEHLAGNYPANLDLVILQGDGNTSTNGEFDDQLDGENPVNTWTARVNYLIRAIRARYPNIVIALMVDNVWYTGEVNDAYTTDKNRYMYSQIKGLADYNRCAFLDVDHNTPFNPTHGLDNYYTQYKVGSTSVIDGVHPNSNYLTAKAYCVAHHIAGLVYNPDAPNTEVEGWQDKVSYAITNNLTNATNSNTAVDWAANTPYSAKVTGATSVSVTMGGVDITSDVYNNGNISIASVTGDIVITAE